MSDAKLQVVRQSDVRTTLAILSNGCPTHQVLTYLTDSRDGSVYRLFIAKPNSPPPQAGYPVLYMLDGNGVFDIMTADLLAEVPDLCIVGIGYDSPNRLDAVRRSLDYTPSPSGIGPDGDPRHPDRLTGGAALFLERLNNELIDGAETHFTADTARRSLWGHSFGGLFTLYALLQGAKFDRYIAASPAVWWRNGYLLEVEAKLHHRRAEVLVMLGDKERRSEAGTQVTEGPAPLTMELAARLASHPELTVSTHIFHGASHVDSLFASVPLALKAAAAHRVQESE